MEKLRELCNNRAASPGKLLCWALNCRVVPLHGPVGLHAGAWLGKSLFRPAPMMAMRSVEKEGGFKAEDASPEKAVAERPFPVLFICGTRDHTIPFRHAERIYKVARGSKELWIVPGAEHASALGHAPAEYEARVINLFRNGISSQ